MKPPVAYYGGKTRIAPRIAKLLPPHEHYVEPFAGSLAVLLAKEPAPYETVNDLNRDVMTFWRVLRDRPADLQRACELTPHGRAELADAYEDSPDELEQARRVWVRLTQGRTARMTTTGWRFRARPIGGTPTRDIAGYLDRMAVAAGRLAHVSLECRPALDVIATYAQHEGVLIYADPPYLAATRNGTNYEHEMASEQDHRALAEALTDCRAKVVLSGYASPLYVEMYDGWHVTELATVTSQGNGKDGYDPARVEVLWSNVPLADAGELDWDVA
jgi:DNA adenine methylase